VTDLEGADVAGAAGAVLVADRVYKTYGGVVALDDATVDFRAGQIHSLLGENGAGKSTLIKVIVGAVQPDGGELIWQGEPVRMATRRQATERGVRVVFQHSSLIEHLTVADNLDLGEEVSRLGWLGRGRSLGRAPAMLERLGLHVDLQTPVGRLGVGERQLVEIARALRGDAKLLILDEPTASLGETEADRLLGVVRQVADAGTAVIYVSHRIDEVISLSDRITVMRDGTTVATLGRGATKQQLVEMMVGHAVPDRLAGIAHPTARRAVTLRSVSSDEGLRDVHLDLNVGEVLGVYGLLGSGRTELAHVVAAVRAPSKGVVDYAWTSKRPTSSSQARAAGIGFVPEDRVTSGVITGRTVRENVTVSAAERISRALVVDTGADRRLAEEALAKLRIVTSGVEAPIETLSGGNQQKAVVGRWFVSPRRLLVLDDPTVGVDVGARHELHRLVIGLAEQGASILLTSSDLDELFALCHRIIVMRDRTIGGVVEADRFDKRTCLNLALGE